MLHAKIVLNSVFVVSMVYTVSMNCGHPPDTIPFPQLTARSNSTKYNAVRQTSNLISQVVSDSLNF